MAEFAYNPSSEDETEEGSLWPSNDGGDIPSTDAPHVHVEETLNVMGSIASSNVQENGSPAIPAAGDAAKTPETMAARAYQLEMLDRSLKQNVIVSVCELSLSFQRAWV